MMRFTFNPAIYHVEHVGVAIKKSLCFAFHPEALR